MNKENCTKGPTHTLPEDREAVFGPDGRPLASVAGYGREASEREANAELIAEAFNVLHETGMTPRELVKALRRLYDATSCIDGMLDGDRDKQEAWEDEVSELDRARAEANLILSHQPVTPA